MKRIIPQNLELYGNSVKTTLKIFPQVLRKAWLEIAITFFLTEAFYQHFLLQSQKISHLPQAQMMTELGLLTLSFNFGLVMLFLLPMRANEVMNNLPRQGFWDFCHKHGLSLIIEGFKVFAYTLLWLLLFVIPGIYKYVRYFFVPFIVMFDKEYHSNPSNIDALKKSEKLIAGMTFSLFILLGLKAVIDYYLDIFKRSLTIFDNLWNWLIFSPILLFFSLFSSTFMYVIFALRFKEESASETPTKEAGEKNEPNLQMEPN